MGGVVSFSRSSEDTWYAAGWAFRQLLEDVSRQYANDSKIVEELDSAELHAGLMIDLLDPSIATRITDAISKVIDGILNHTIRSGIEEKPYGDRMTVEQYLEALNELSRIIRRRSND